VERLAEKHARWRALSPPLRQNFRFFSVPRPQMGGGGNNTEKLFKYLLESDFSETSHRKPKKLVLNKSNMMLKKRRM
jgi:hypothetical protein